MFTVGAQLLVVAVVVLAAWIVTDLALIARAWSVTGITPARRLWLLVPLATPFIGWRAGKKWHAGLCFIFMASYIGLRIALALR